MNPSNENAEILAIVNPYLQRIIENHPRYGSAGLTIIFTDGLVARVDVSETVQRKLAPRAYREGGQQ